MDGTLLDSRQVALEGSRRGLAQLYAALGLEPEPLEDADIVALIGSPSLDYFRSLLPPSLAHHAEEVRGLVGAHERELLQQGWGHLFPGAAETLAWLRSRGVLLGVVTNCYTRYCRAAVQAVGLEDHVHVVFCLGDAPPGSSKTDLVAMALRELRAPAAIVGDRVYDFHAGRSHGLLTVACSWGYGPPHELEEADLLAADFAQVRHLLQPYLEPS